MTYFHLNEYNQISKRKNVSPREKSPVSLPGIQDKVILKKLSQMNHTCSSAETS